MKATRMKRIKPRRKVTVDFTPTKKLTLDFTPNVFLQERTHAYLLVESHRNHEVFLRLGNGVIEAVKMGRGSRLREELVPHPYDFKKAIGVFYSSSMGRTSRVERIMRTILGIPLTDILDDDEPITVESTASEGSKTDFTLSDLCLELGMSPSTARKILRGRVEKPEAGWRWGTREEAHLIRAILMEEQV